jgi:DNA-directed RNA polymerase subunit RPC12/RpoP
LKKGRCGREIVGRILEKDKTDERNNKKKCGNKILREIAEEKKDVRRKFRKIAI